MAGESLAAYDRRTVFAACEEMGEAAVLADLDRAGVAFASSEQKWLAWEWVYSKRLEREKAQSKALKSTALWTFAVAAATFLVAAFAAYTAFWGKQ